MEKQWKEKYVSLHEKIPLHNYRYYVIHLENFTTIKLSCIPHFSINLGVIKVRQRGGKRMERKICNFTSRNSTTYLPVLCNSLGMLYCSCFQNVSLQNCLKKTLFVSTGH